LAIPDTCDKDPTSLITIVKHQVAAVASCSVDFFPLLYIQCSPSSFTTSLTGDLALRRRVETKLSDGDVSGAVRLASSNDTLAPFDNETFSLSIPDVEFPEQPDDSSEVLSVSCSVVSRAIRSYKAGSAGGLRPQHFKELISNSTGEAGVCFLKSLTSLVNCMLSGKFTLFFIHSFWG